MRIKNKRTGAMYQSDTLVKSSSGFFWDKKNQMGAINLLFTEDDSWEEESVTPWISVKQADFAFEPVTLKMFAHAYKLHCEELKKGELDE